MSATPWNDPHSTTHLRTNLTPYLTLSHHLSLTWLAAPILSIIFVAFRLLLSLSDAQNALAKTKVNLLASCLAAEQAATSTVSMPRYLALATNKQFAEAVNGSIQAARFALIVSITALESIINFVVDIYRSTFLCLLELVVRGGLSIIISAVKEISSAVETVGNALRTTLQDEISTASNLVKRFADIINNQPFIPHVEVPEINVPNLNGLQNIQIPSSFQESLVKLNDTIPSSSEVKQKLEAVMDIPFELLKKEINETFLGLSFSPDGLPIPEQHSVKFCAELDTSIVDDLSRDLIKTVKLGIFILIAVAGFLITANCLLTWYRWRCLKRHFEYTRQAWMTDPTVIPQTSPGSAPQITLNDHNLMMLEADSQHPFVTRIMNQISSRFRLTPRQHIHARWYLQYIFYAPAVACLLVGLFGILSVELQLFAVRPLQAKFGGQADAAVADFNQVIASSITSSMQNQSTTYANEVNGRVIKIETTLNEGLFGWVNVTTTTLNNTISEVYTDIQKAVTLVFGGSILEAPAQQFVRCLIGSKVEAIENALTFLHDNLKVSLPRMNTNVLVLSPESVNEATGPISAAAIGGNTDDEKGFLGKVIQTYVDGLKKERLMFMIFVGLWVLVCLLGLIVVFWHSMRKAKDSDQPMMVTFPSDNEKGGNNGSKFDSLKWPSDSLLWKPKFPSWPKSKVVAPRPPRTFMLLALLRKLFSRAPRPPVQETKSPVDGWYTKIMKLLARKEKAKIEKPPKLRVVSPVKKETVPIPPPKRKQSPTFVPLVLPNTPPVVIPRELERGSTPPPRITSKTPLLAEFLTFPVPLHAGFDSSDNQEVQSKRNKTRSRSSSISSIGMASPMRILYQTPLAPVPPPLVVQHSYPTVTVPPESLRRHRSRSASFGGTDPQTNTLPGEFPPIPSVQGSEIAYNNNNKLPISRPLGTADANATGNSAVSPFVTPFDDEFRVRED